MCLRLHAAGRNGIHNVRNELHQLGDPAERFVEDSQNMADAREKLNNVVKTNDAIVARVRHN